MLKINYKRGMVLLIILLFLGASVGTYNIQATRSGGWHDLVTKTKYGKDFDSISGQWEYYGSHAIRMSRYDNECTATYLIDIEDTCVKEGMKVGIYFCDWAAFPWAGGPDLKVYNWDSSSWKTWGNVGNHDELQWVWKTPSNSNKYVNDNGIVKIRVWAAGDDDTILDKVGVKFQAADEEIVETDVTLLDDDSDGYNDGVEIDIYADVGSDGDGTTVEVTADAVLIGPDEVTYATDSDTWTIVDWEEEYGTVTLSALNQNAPPGIYEWQITLYDEYGNNEDYAEETVSLKPGPYIEFNTDSHDFGEIKVGKESDPIDFILTNIGAGTASGSVSLSGSNPGQFKITSGSGSFSISAGSSKTIKVKFKPTSQGYKTANLDADGSNCNDDSVALSGTGIANPPYIELTPDEHDFSYIKVNSESDEFSFTLTNIGGQTAVGSVYLDGSNPGQFKITSGGGSFSLSAESSKTIKVKFKPTSKGNKNAELVADADNCDDDISDLYGTGVVAPQVTTKKPEKNINNNKATLKGKIDDDGAQSCKIRFRYRKKGATDWIYPSDWSGSYGTGESFSELVGPLKSAEVYQFQAGAKNIGGTTWGNTYEFTMPFYFVHVTDLHVHLFNTDRWNKVKNEILNLPYEPRFVISSGDNVEWGIDPFGGGSENYEALTDTLTWEPPWNWHIDDDKLIPICFSPGNHERYFWPYDLLLLNYRTHISPLTYYKTEIGNCAIFSFDSGMDLFFTGDFIPPEATGLDLNDVLTFEDDLDNLDGNPDNNCDTSGKFKIVFMHHPIKNPENDCNNIEDGTFTFLKDDFTQLCNQYGVHVVCFGHIHRDSVFDLDGNSWEPGETCCIMTASVKNSKKYRPVKIDTDPVLGDDYQITVMDPVQVGSSINFQIACEIDANANDETGSTTGYDPELGEVVYEIPAAHYFQYNFSDHGIDETVTDFCVDHDSEEDYDFYIYSNKDDLMNLTIEIELMEGYWSKATYTDIQMYKDSEGYIEAPESIVNYTISIQDPGSEEPRKVVPSIYEGNLPPIKPEAPWGPKGGKINVEYTYNATGIDPDYNEYLYFKFDWGDGDQSGWIGPVLSGGIVQGSHTWTREDDFNIKVKSKDDDGVESEWSEHLRVSMPDTKNYGCFQGTQITMTPGVTVPIEFIQVGDHIQSYDLRNDQLVSVEVIGVNEYTENLPEGYLIINNVLKIAGEYSLYADAQAGIDWCLANNVVMGDFLYANPQGPDLFWEEIISINEAPTLQDTRFYDIIINQPDEYTNGYWANGILVGG